MAAIQRAERLRREAFERFDREDYAASRRLAEQVVALRERVLGAEHPDVATDLNMLGLVLHQQADLVPARAVLERALRIREATLGPTSPAVADSLVNLARVLYAAGRFTDARPILERALSIREAALGRDAPDVGICLVHLGIVQAQIGALTTARETLERAAGVLEEARPPRPLDLAMALNALGNMHTRAGDHATARRVLERSLVLRETALGREHSHVARTLTRLGTVAAAMEDLESARSLLGRALGIQEKALGAQHPEVAGSLNELGRIERRLQHLDVAARMFERALEIQGRSIGPTHPFFAVTLIELAETRRQAGDPLAARPLFEQALAVQEQSLGPDHPFLAETLTSLGYLEGQAENYATAEARLARALAVRENALGPTHPDVTTSLFDLARAKHARGNLAGARPLYERARQNLLLAGRVNHGLGDAALARMWGAQLAGLEDYAILLAREVQDADRDADRHSAVRAGFMVAQQARGWIVQAAVARAMARTDVTGASVARDFEALRRRRESLWDQLNAVYAEPSPEGDAGRHERLKAEVDRVQRELDATLVRLQTTSPAYAEMAAPRPVEIATLERWLAGDQALVIFYTLPDRVQVWLVRRGQPPAYHAAAIARSALIALVSRVRDSVAPAPGAVLRPFDVQSAFALYRLLLQPLERHLAGVSDLVVVPDVVLLPLPFAALVTDDRGDVYRRLAGSPPRRRIAALDEMAEYAALPWLATSYAVAVLPSVSALRLTAQPARPRTDAVETFIGFGDPVLRGAGDQRGGAMVAMRGAQAPLASLNALNRLPGTRRELVAVARELGVDPDANLYLDARATERNVKRLNAEGRLGRARVLAFATHGLLAGQYGVAQPALVLTPPAVASDDDDGLLSLDEILALDLSGTDLVLLSACNTAGTDGSGEGLSGLARAFLFAGSKALMVSYWSVSDRSTEALMTAVFKRHPALPAARALREAMLTLLHHQAPGEEYFHHPFAWAAFSIVGIPPGATD